MQIRDRAWSIQYNQRFAEGRKGTWYNKNWTGNNAKYQVVSIKNKPGKTKIANANKNQIADEYAQGQHNTCLYTAKDTGLKQCDKPRSEGDGYGKSH